MATTNSKNNSSPSPKKPPIFTKNISCIIFKPMTKWVSQFQYINWRHPEGIWVSPSGFLAWILFPQEKISQDTRWVKIPSLLYRRAKLSMGPDSAIFIRAADLSVERLALLYLYLPGFLITNLFLDCLCQESLKSYNLFPASHSEYFHSNWGQVLQSDMYFLTRLGFILSKMTTFIFPLIYCSFDQFSPFGKLPKHS